MDFGRGDPLCGGLCVVSAGCEVASGVIVWIPFPGKICTVAGLKTVSVGCVVICVGQIRQLQDVKKCLI